MDALEQALRLEKSVKFIYTIPNFQNPMGVVTLERSAPQTDVLIWRSSTM